MTANDDGRPGQGRPSESPAGSGTTPMLARGNDNPLRRRRASALRLPPHDDGVRDPLDRLAHPDQPSTYGLDETELRRYANRLVLAEGWSTWEVRQRLAITPRTQCCPCCRHHQEAAA